MIFSRVVLENLNLIILMFDENYELEALELSQTNELKFGILKASHVCKVSSSLKFRENMQSFELFSTIDKLLSEFKNK